MPKHFSLLLINKQQLFNVNLYLSIGIWEYRLLQSWMKKLQKG